MNRNIQRFSNTLIATIIVISAAYAPLALAESSRIVGDHHFGCISRDYFERLTKAAVQKDMEAFKKGYVSGMITGACVMFTSGEEVFITDTAMFSGLVKVRRSGDLTEYWTNFENIK